MDKEILITLNHLAANNEQRNLETDVLQKPIETRRLFLNELATMIIQAETRLEDLASAVSASTLKATCAPCVIFMRSTDYKIALQKILTLPDQEYLKAFLLLLALFKVADDRRFKNKCFSGCKHWWHQAPFR